MTVPQAALAAPPQSTDSRQTAVSVHGATVFVPCPAWCTDSHTEPYAFLEDVSHHGEAVSLGAPSFSGQPDRVLVARVSQWPYTSDAATARPYLSLDAAGDGECAELDATAATAFADQLVAHAVQLRALAERLSTAA